MFNVRNDLNYNFLTFFSKQSMIVFHIKARLRTLHIPHKSKAPYPTCFSCVHDQPNLHCSSLQLWPHHVVLPNAATLWIGLHPRHEHQYGSPPTLLKGRHVSHKTSLPVISDTLFLPSEVTSDFRSSSSLLSVPA